MKIGIIIHSFTGNTNSVAEKLKDRLTALNHSAVIEKVIPENESEHNLTKIKLKNSPDPLKYDALVFGAPVHGFSLSAGFRFFLNNISSLSDKKIACFVTHFFPLPWMGGTRAVSQMKKICESKNAEIRGSGVIDWASSKRDKKIEDLIEKFSIIF